MHTDFSNSAATFSFFSSGRVGLGNLHSARGRLAPIQSPRDDAYSTLPVESDEQSINSHDYDSSWPTVIRRRELSLMFVNSLCVVFCSAIASATVVARPLSALFRVSPGSVPDCGAINNSTSACWTRRRLTLIAHCSSFPPKTLE